MTELKEDRGFRVRVVYPIIAEYRYAVYPSAKDWRVADRPKATIFPTESLATEAAQVISENTDVRAVGGSATVEPIQSFDPDWCLPTGVHLKECMDQEQVTHEEMARRLGLTSERLQALLDGTTEYVSSDLAQKLESATGRPAQYWYNLETRYREGIRMGLTVTR